VPVQRGDQLEQLHLRMLRSDPSLAPGAPVPPARPWSPPQPAEPRRPHLPRDFDDGGLVDINSAPEHVLAALPGVRPRIRPKLTRGPGHW
jgi:hypothetical protein